jgi:uncharacterized protein YggE
MRMLLIAMIGLLVTGPVLAEDKRITVTGSGQVSVDHDMATVHVSVVADGKTAAEALSRNSDQMSAVFVRLDELGIEAGDRQTSGLSLYPIRNQSSIQKQNTPEIVGFSARNSLSLRLRDLDAVGEVLDGLVTQGINGIDSLQFGVDDPKPVLDEARRLAVKDALGKAALFAQAAGVKAGAVTQISEQGTRGTPQPMHMAEASLRAVPVAAGEVGFSATVTLVIELE